MTAITKGRTRSFDDSLRGCVLLLLMALTLAAGLALAPQADARVITSKNVSSADIDGLMVYRVEYSRSGIANVLGLNLAGGSNTLVYQAPNKNTVVSRVRIGGNRVAIGTTKFGRTRITDTVKVANADGSGITDLATATYDAAHDCGDLLALADVSSTGEVFVSAASVNRANVACGDGATNYTTAINGYAPNGTVRTAHSATGTDIGKAFFSSLPVDVQVNGDNLAFATPRSAHTVDLPTGTTATYAPRMKNTYFTHVSIDASGQLLTSESRVYVRKKKVRRKGSKRKRTVKTYSGVSALMLYTRKSDPSSGTQLYASSKRVAQGNICGSRYYRSTGPFTPGPQGDFLINNAEINQSGVFIRPFLPDDYFISDFFFACDANNALLDGFDVRTGRSRLDVVPIG